MLIAPALPYAVQHGKKVYNNITFQQQFMHPFIDGIKYPAAQQLHQFAKIIVSIK